MAKSGNRKKKKNGVAAMDVSAAENKEEDLPQEMDTTETIAQTPRSQVPGVLNRKIKKGGVPMKRAKNIRKMKAIQKAISRDEKKEEKSLKQGNKVLRTQSAKTLYE